MSHQGHEGWFPECIVCRSGNVGAIVCLDPTCHEAHGDEPIVRSPSAYVHGDLVVDEKLIEEGGHLWKCCQLCDRRVHADPGAFGSYALCVDCFNRYVAAKRSPPISPWDAEKDFQSGVVRLEDGNAVVEPAGE